MLDKILSLQKIANQRLFAVVHLVGRQRVITTGDLLMLDTHMEPECGQKILINKCLLLGGKDFSIIGRPALDKDMFRIEATIVEKTMSDHKLIFKHRPRNHGIVNYFYHANPRTVLRINNIELKRLPEDIEDLSQEQCNEQVQY